MEQNTILLIIAAAFVVWYFFYSKKEKFGVPVLSSSNRQFPSSIASRTRSNANLFSLTQPDSLTQPVSVF